MSAGVTGSSSETLENHPLAERREIALSRIGQVIAGRWTLTKVLGIGGTATVYQASHRNGRRAALKVLHPEFAKSPAVVRRFLSEGYAANKVGHTGAVLVLDDGEDAGLVFSVMELLEGRSLAERLAERGPLPVEDVARIALAVLDVLAAAHDRGVVHRDVKPSNVFELADGSVKLLDFGVAQVREPGAESVTQSGFTVGTPAFMAPEQAAGRSEEVDALTDIWAVGASMFQLVTGRLVHDAGTPNAALVAAATKPVPAIRSLLPELDAGVASVIDRALAFARDERWPNARAMSRALSLAVPAAGGDSVGSMPLAPALETLPEAPSPEASPEPAPAAKPARKTAAIAVSIAAAGAVVILARSGNSPKPTSPNARLSASIPAIVSAPIVEHRVHELRTAAPLAAESVAPPSPQASVVAPKGSASAMPKPKAPGRAPTLAAAPAKAASATPAPAPAATPARVDSEESILDRRR